MSDNKILKVTDKNFDKEVMRSKRPVLVDFSATWCGPCTKLSPVLDVLATERPDLKIVKMDVGGNKKTGEASNPVTRETFKVKVFPTLYLLRGGKVAGVRFGGDTKKNIAAWIDEALAKPAASDMDTVEAVEQADKQREAIQKEASEKLLQVFNTTARKGSMLSSALKIAGAFTLATVNPVLSTALLGGLVMGQSTLNFHKAYTDRPKLFSTPSRLNTTLKTAFNAATLASGVMLLGAPATGIIGTAALVCGIYMAARGGLGIAGSAFGLLTGKNVSLGAKEITAEENCADGACPVDKQDPTAPKP